MFSKCLTTDWRDGRTEIILNITDGRCSADAVAFLSLHLSELLGEKWNPLSSADRKSHLWPACRVPSSSLYFDDQQKMWKNCYLMKCCADFWLGISIKLTLNFGLSFVILKFLETAKAEVFITCLFSAVPENFCGLLFTGPARTAWTARIPWAIGRDGHTRTFRAQRGQRWTR